VGAGYVRLSTPGGAPGAGAPLEAVGTPLPTAGWAADVLDGVDRFAAVVVGPGLGRDDGTAAEVRRLVDRCPVPVVVDGDGLAALGERPSLRRSTVLTPHDGEHARLTGAAPGPDRVAAAGDLARTAGCFVLLKGSTTAVAAPDTGVFLITAGDARLATAGTGDVLSGAIGGLLAQGVDPGRAAAAGAHLHGRAAHLGPVRGLVAGDLPDLLPAALASVAARG
jgi:NAD(P)H-hydrate epimerase